jgi:malate dehydrogenase (oxaloacetate-decarboxylating)(NADP+)
MAVRQDAIIATGRTDYPNQVNNVLGFPFIFRGALDVRARAINEEMKLAATYALADLAKEDVPEAVADAYGKQSFSFGPEYLIPKPFDYRVLLWVAPAVARAAMESGVARQTVDLEQYRNALESRLGRRREVMRDIILKAKQEPKRIVYPEGEHERVLRAAAQIVEEGIAHPVLIGHPERIRACAAAHGVELTGIETIPPQDYDLRVERYATKLFEKRQRKGLTMSEARARMRQPVYFGCMMVEEDDADGLVAGENTNYPETIRPALEVIGTAPDSRHVAGLYMMVLQHDIMFFADTTVNIEPDAATLAEIALMSAAFVRRLGIRPALAMLSFSNFGSTRVPQAERVKHAVEIVKSRAPNLTVEGEMQVDVAVLPELLAAQFPFSRLKERANVLIFPDLNAANIAYKLLWRLGGAEAIGPILLGMDRPIHVLQRDASAADIVNLSALAVVDAQRRAPRPLT